MKSKVLLQIDSCLGVGSTGRISENIGALAKERGWDCYVAHGGRYVGTTKLKSITITSKWGEYIHFAKSLLLDNHGLNSTHETKLFIKKIEKIRPDVVQLHCLHGYYVNYHLLFNYLIDRKIPIVWTLHDCWNFTGHCAHFDVIQCRKWQNQCDHCPLKGDYPASALMDRSEKNFKLKKALFTKVPNLTLVPVSYWLENFVHQSFFEGLPNVRIETIHNGTAISIFKPADAKEITAVKRKFSIPQDNFVAMGCAAPWTDRKGYHDFFELRKVLPDNVTLLMVGLNKNQIKKLPKGIIGVQRTDTVSELATLYSASNVLLNPTYSDNFPTTNIEALACGIPVITYNTGGSPEAIDVKTGAVCEQGNIEEMAKLCMEMILKSDDIRTACRNRAVELYDKEKCFSYYVNLYDSLVRDK